MNQIPDDVPDELIQAAVAILKIALEESEKKKTEEKKEGAP
ncbi:MAG: hypothetical protein QM817_03255 [Archangium sp.]